MSTATPAVAARARRPATLARPVSAHRLAVPIALALGIVPLVSVLGDPDLWWHLRLGRWILDNHAVPQTELFTYTASGAPVTAHEWGFEVIAAALLSGIGLLGTTLVLCLAGWSGLVALALRARVRAVPPLAIAVSVLLAAKALQPISGPRPQMITFALLCWTLYLAERHLERGGRLVWAVVPLLLVWANLHAGVVAGPGVLLAVGAIEAWTLRRRADPVRRARLRVLGIAGLVGTAATLLNPMGAGLWRYAMSGASAERGRPIVEWQSPDFHSSADLGLLVLIVAFAALAGATRGPGLRDGILGVLGIVAALLAVRNIALCAALTTPAVATMLGAVSNRVGALRGELRLRPASVLALAGAAVAALAVGTVRAASDASAAGVAAAYPECSAQVLLAADGPVRLLAAYGDGGFMVERAWPQVRVYAYGNDNALSDTLVGDYLRLMAGGPDAPGLLDGSATNAVLAPAGGDLDHRLAQTDGWRPVLLDHGRALWVRGLVPGPAPAGC